MIRRPPVDILDLRLKLKKPGNDADARERLLLTAMARVLDHYGFVGKRPDAITLLHQAGFTAAEVLEYADDAIAKLKEFDVPIGGLVRTGVALLVAALAFLPSPAHASLFHIAPDAQVFLTGFFAAAATLFPCGIAIGFVWREKSDERQRMRWIEEARRQPPQMARLTYPKESR